MARTRTRRVSRGTAKRRKLVWARVIAQDVDVAANTSVFTNLTSAFETLYGAQLIGATVMRIRLRFFNPAANVGLPIIYGVRINNDSQFDNLDNASGPGTDAHADWMTWGMLNSGDPLVTDIDVKSMRKFEEIGDGVMLGLSNVTATGAVDLDFTASLLIALP